MNSFGNNFRVEISGESRGRAVTVIIDGVKPGVKISEEVIGRHLSLRRPSEDFETARAEADRFEILSGVYGGYTTGTPVCVTVFSDDAREDGTGFFRPGHADYTQYAKYGKTADLRGGGHASGRITVGLSVAGALASSILAEKGISAGTHILRCCGVSDAETDFSGSEAEILSSRKFPVLDGAAGEEMKRRLSELRKAGETAGAILETGITGIPAGVGEPFFAGVESEISRAVFSVPGVKGIEFGLGFGFADTAGSASNDMMTCRDGKITFLSNRCGGLNGGITNGMPVIFRTAVRAPSSVATEQDTVSYPDMRNTVCTVGGRNDCCFAPRAAHVINAAAGIAILDLLCSRFGTELNGL